MNPISVLLVILVAFFAGMEGILDEFQFHQPLIACTLIGIVTGHPTEGIILGGTLQMMALGWANIGAAVAPTAINTAIALAVPLSVAGLFLTMLCRTIAIPMVHFMDAAAEKADFRGVEIWQLLAIALQGVRIAIPAAMLCMIPAEAVTAMLQAMPAWLAGGMAVGGGMVAAVGYAMVINMMATPEVWPFFALGFVIACIPSITLIGLGVIGIALALIYLGLKDLAKQGGGAGGGSGDPLGDILNDY